MTKNKGITYTVISCLAIVSMVIGLFVYSTVAEKELTNDQYKLLEFYQLNTKRDLNLLMNVDLSKEFIYMSDYKLLNKEKLIKVAHITLSKNFFIY